MNESVFLSIIGLHATSILSRCSLATYHRPEGTTKLAPSCIVDDEGEDVLHEDHRKAKGEKHIEDSNRLTCSWWIEIDVDLKDQCWEHGQGK